MSRTDKDRPWRILEGDMGYSPGYDTRTARVSPIRRKHLRHERQSSRIELQQGLPIGVDYCVCGFAVEGDDNEHVRNCPRTFDGYAVPAAPPAQHRHSALWEAW